MGLKQPTLLYKKTTITTAWAYGQPIDSMRQVAIDLCNYAKSVLQTTGAIEFDASGSPVMHACWNFSDADSSSLALWEIVVEIPSLYASAMPTMVMPTEESLRFILKSGRAVVAVLGLLGDSRYKEVRMEIKKLRRWVRVVEELLGCDAKRHKLLQIEVGGLEEAREACEEEGDEGRLLELIGQAAPRQEWMTE